MSDTITALVYDSRKPWYSYFPGPIDVSTLAALPVFGRKQSFAFLSGLFADVGKVLQGQEDNFSVRWINWTKRLYWRRKAVSRELYLFCFRFVATAEPRTRSPAGVVLAPDTRRCGCVGGLLFSASVALLPVGKAEIAATEIKQPTWISISNSTWIHKEATSVDVNAICVKCVCIILPIYLSLGQSQSPSLVS